MTVTTLFRDDVEFVSSPPIAAPNRVAQAFAAAARAVASWRAERARRIALNDLLGMDPHRLRDLGITPHDVQQALQQRRARR